MISSVANKKIKYKANPSKSHTSRAKYGQGLYAILMAQHKQHPFTWKADIALPKGFTLEEARKSLTKLSRAYPKDEAPAFLMFEESAKGRLNAHIVGRGEMTKAQLRDLLINACTHGRSKAAREATSKAVEVHFEKVEYTFTKNPQALLNYLCKTSFKLAKKLTLLPSRTRNYRDLGVLGPGGIAGARREFANSKKLPTKLEGRSIDTPEESNQRRPMRNGWRNIQEERQLQFNTHVIPWLLKNWDVMAIRSLEGHDNPLDIDCDIDCIITRSTGETQGMAVRVVNHQDYENFALKYPREWSYLKTPGNLRPEWICQAFIINGSLHSLGLIRVQDLIEEAEGLIKTGEARIVPTREGDKSFLLIPWIHLLNMEKEFHADY